MGEFDAVGDIVTGALAGRAVERESSNDTGHMPHGACLNCGTGLIGPHCHRCGQAGHVHRTIGAIFHEILHGVVHFEGKLWSTLPMLAWRPGVLTRRYVAGERARFVSPMALFLFSIFTMFAVFSIVGLSPPADLGGSGQASAGFDAARKEMVESRDDAASALKAAAPNSRDARRAQAQLTEAESNLAMLERSQKLVGGDKTADDPIKTGWARLDYGIAKAQKNPGLLLYKMQANSYKFSWLLIPLSLPFMWLMFFWKRQYKIYDHAVFVTYSIAFMSLLFIVLTVLGALGVSMGLLFTAGTFIPVWHLYRQLRGAYQLRRFSALLRTMLLLVFINLIVTIFLLLTIGLGLIG